MDQTPEIIFGYFDKTTFIKYLRLAIIVCGYVLLRTLYMNYASKKHVERQIAMDEQEKAREPELKAKEEAEAQQKLEDEAQTFGWGKKTRAKYKSRQAILEQEIAELRNREAFDADSDEDIKDLLED